MKVSFVIILCPYSTFHLQNARRFCFLQLHSAIHRAIIVDRYIFPLGGGKVLERDCAVETVKLRNVDLQSLGKGLGQILEKHDLEVEQLVGVIIINNVVGEHASKGRQGHLCWSRWSVE